MLSFGAMQKSYNENEAEFGVPLFSPIESETFALNWDLINSTDEEQSVFSQTNMIEQCYGDKCIVVNELRMEDLSWLED